MSDVIHAFMGSILVGYFFSFGGEKLLQSKIPKKFNSILMIFGLILLLTLGSLFFENALKMMVIYIIVLFMYRTLFKKNISQCAMAALISYLLLTIGELAFAIGLGLADKIIDLGSISTYTGNLFVNICISLIALIILLLIYKPLSGMIAKIKENNKITLVFTFALLLVTIWFLFYKIFINDFKFDEILLINGFLIIAMVYIGVVIIKQRYDKSRISEEYETYVEYSKQSEKLVEEYSISQHENKNELIIIKSMVHKSNKRLLEYLDEIITSKDNIESAWIRYLRYIPFGGLKGIVHNKISVMKDLGINVFLDISKEIGKSKLKDLNMKENNQLSKIIGVFLDNAKEASLLSKRKEVSISIFMDGTNVIFEISNTYLDKKVDLDKIYELGHSTKGKGHGYGLSLVKSIVDENNMLDNETKIVDEYFIQLLTVKLQK